jgi:hypothetical protein
MLLQTGVVVHAFNHSYFGGRGRQIKSLRPVQTKVRETISETNRKPKWLGAWLKR